MAAERRTAELLTAAGKVSITFQVVAAWWHDAPGNGSKTHLLEQLWVSQHVASSFGQQILACSSLDSRWISHLLSGQGNMSCMFVHTGV